MQNDNQFSLINALFMASQLFLIRIFAQFSCYFFVFFYYVIFEPFFVGKATSIAGKHLDSN